MRQSQHGCYGKIQDYCFFDNNMPSCSQENDIGVHYFDAFKVTSLRILMRVSKSQKPYRPLLPKTSIALNKVIAQIDEHNTFSQQTICLPSSSK